MSPAYGFISCGKDNDYGHPTDKTLNTLAKYNVSIYRSDVDGVVTCASDGENYAFSKDLSQENNSNGNTDYATIQKTLDGYVALGLQLVHWWSYDTCRQASFGDDQSWNMNMTEFPESVALVKAANEALKAKWLVNRADEEVVVTDTGDSASTETPPAATEPVTDPASTSAPETPDTPETPNTPSETTPSEKGCGASLSGLAGAALTALGWMLLRKRED